VLYDQIIKASLLSDSKESKDCTMQTSNLKLMVAQLIKKVFPIFGIQTFSASYTSIHDLIMNGQVVEGVQNFRY
jgi:hypothetical protein